MTQTNDWWLRATAGAIVMELRACCDSIPAGETRSTVELVEMAFPIASTRGAGVERRAYLYNRLMKGADRDFKGYWTRGEPRQGQFGLKRPYLWHAPKGACLTCNGTGVVL